MASNLIEYLPLAYPLYYSDKRWQKHAKAILQCLSNDESFLHLDMKPLSICRPITNYSVHDRCHLDLLYTYLVNLMFRRNLFKQTHVQSFPWFGYVWISCGSFATSSLIPGEVALSRTSTLGSSLPTVSLRPAELIRFCQCTMCRLSTSVGPFPT